MRFGQGLIYALTNPQMGQNLFNVGQQTGQTLAGQPRQIAALEKEKRDAIQAAQTNMQEGTAAAQQGDVAAIGKKIRDLQTAGQNTNSSQAQQVINTQIEKLQAMMPAAEQAGTLNSAKGILNVDQALADESLAPEIRTVLEERRNVMLNDPDTAKAYSAAKAAQFEAQQDATIKQANMLLKTEDVRQLKVNQASSEALSMLVNGAKPASLSERYPPEVMEKANEKYAKFMKTQNEMEEMVTNGTPPTAEQIDTLLPAQKAALDGMKGTATQAAINTQYRKFVLDNTVRDIAKADEFEAQSIETRTAKYLRNRDSEWAADENVAEWYRSLDEEDQPDIEKEVGELMATAVNNKEENPAEYVNQVMSQRYGIDVGRQTQRGEEAAEMTNLVQLYMAENEGIPEAVARERVQNMIDERTGSEAIKRGNIN